MSLLQQNEFYPRLRCECCGYPTRLIDEARGFTGLEYWTAQTGCLLCDWENAPVDETFSPVADAPSAEERNDGYSIERARDNFRLHTWMYDPAVLEAWMLAPTTEKVLALRRSLRTAYDSLARDPEDYAQWQRVLDLENALLNAIPRVRDEDVPEE